MPQFVLALLWKPWSFVRDWKVNGDLPNTTIASHQIDTCLCHLFRVRTGQYLVLMFHKACKDLSTGVFV